MEPIAAASLSFGVVILFASWVQLIITSFREDYNWGLTSLFLPPLSYLYSVLSWDKAREPVLMAALGLALIASAFL